MSEIRSASMFGSGEPTNGCVLVVEDEPQVREVMRDLLERAGYAVLEAENAEKGIAAINAGENPLVVDTVITDIDMGRGIEAVAYFRTNYPHVPLIVMTGFPETSKDGDPRTRIGIVGAGKGGLVLLGMFSHLPEVEIVGIADKDPAAPGLKRARELKIPVEDTASLIARADLHLIVDVTGDPDMAHRITAQKRPGVELLGGTAARLLWNLAQYEAQMQRQVIQSQKVAGMIKAGVTDFLVKPIGKQKLLTAVCQAMEHRQINRL